MTGHAVEVPYKSDHEERIARKQLLASRHPDVKPPVGDVDDPGWEDPRFDVDVDDLPIDLPGEALEDVLDRGEDARLLTLAGLAVTLPDLKLRKADLGTAALQLPTREVEGIAYSGTTARVQLDNERAVEVFSGVESGLLAAVTDLSSGAKSEKGQRRQALADELRNTTSRSRTSASPSGEEIAVQSADGSALLVRLT